MNLESMEKALIDHFKEMPPKARLVALRRTLDIVNHAIFHELDEAYQNASVPWQIDNMRVPTQLHSR